MSSLPDFQTDLSRQLGDGMLRAVPEAQWVMPAPLGAEFTTEGART